MVSASRGRGDRNEAPAVVGILQVKKTAFAQGVRCASLGSRRTLCGNERVSSLKTDGKMRDACLELQKNKKSSSKKKKKGDEGKGGKSGAKKRKKKKKKKKRTEPLTEQERKQKHAAGGLGTRKSEGDEEEEVFFFFFLESLDRVCCTRPDT